MNEKEMLFANKISDVISKIHNLSFLKYKVQRFPWIKGLKSQSHGRLTFFMEQGCSVGCLGCFRTLKLSDSLFQMRLKTALNKAFNYDVELVCGDDVDIEALCHTASQFQLAGATRITLKAPIRLIQKAKGIEAFMNAGIWHYILYTTTDSDDLLPTMGPILNSRYYLNILIAIEPFIELVFMGSASNTGTTEKAISNWGQKAQLLTFPDHTDETFCTIEWKNLFFDTLMNSGCVLKLPETVMESILEDFEDNKSILQYMKNFQLIEKFKTTPPCHGGVMDTTLCSKESFIDE